MGSLDKVTTDEAVCQVGRRRAQAARPRRAGRVRARAEDRRARDQPHLRERDLRARRDARRRLARRGRDAEPAHDRRDPALAAARARARRRRPCSRCAARSTCRSPASGSSTSGSSRRGRSRRRTRATRPPARCGRRTREITRGMPLSIWVYGIGYARGARVRVALGDAGVAARARLPDEPVRRAVRVDRGRRGGVPRLGAAPRRARLRDRRDRDQGRLDRAAARARRAARAAALGARVQVGADDRDDAPEQDPDPRRPHGRAQPVGDARAGRGRRRHRLARDAAQRGGHQPQGHPRGRRRDRPARRRRDPADRRAGRHAPPRHEAVQDADALPALRRRDREARGRGDAPLPEPRLPLARARDADQLGAGAGGHRGRRRGDDPAALGGGARALAAGSLPPDEGAAARARRLRRDLGDERDRRDPAVEGAACRSGACCSA